MSFINRFLVLVLLSVPGLAFGQQPVKPVNTTGAVLFPSAFASADNIAAQTATFMHGGLMVWDGANWDRWTGAVTQSGTWNIGTLTTITNPVAVTGTFWQATQPVSGTTFDGILRDGTGDTTQANVSSGRVHVDGSGVTQPISASSLPLPTGAATEASVDGLEGGVGAAADAAATVGSTGSLSAKLRLMTSQLDALSTELAQKTEPANTQTISGTVTANAGTGNFTVVQGTGTNLHMVCDSGCTPGGSTADNSAFTFGTTALNPAGYVFDDTAPNAVTENNVATPRMSANRVPYGTLRDAAGNERGANVTASNALVVDGSASTQPISAASLPLPTGAATSANQDGIIKDGAGDTTQANVSSGRLHVDGSGVTQPVSGTVTVTDGAGALNIICDSGCGGAASFEDNDAFVADTTPVNILGALYDTTPPAVTDGNAGAVRMNSARALMVDGSGVTQPVSGTVAVSGSVTVTDGAGALNVIVDSGSLTANAGTNLNTSALALESGGNLATLAGVIDATGTAVPANAAFVAGTDGTNTRALKTDAGGELQVDVLTMPTVTVTDGAGALNVIVDSSALPSGASTLAEQQTQTTALQKIDNAVYTDNAAISEVAAIGCQFDDTTPGTVTENNVRAVRCSTRREVYGQIRDAAGNERGANVNASNELLTSASITALPNEGQQTAANSISVTPDTDNDPIGATGAAPPGEATYVGGLASGATGGFLTGFAVCDSFVNVNVSTATTTLLVTGVSGRHVRICSMSLVTLAANNVALISGTGATCGTGTTGMNGGTTAAAGWNFAANGGITQGAGLGAINQTNATGDSVCVVTSAATQLSGRLSYAIY